MPALFTVVLRNRTGDHRPSYFTSHNEFVPSLDSPGTTWTSFSAASQAAQRAKLQDIQGRTVTIEEL